MFKVNVDLFRTLAAGDPRVHGNGFIQLDLTDRVRAHFWGLKEIPRQTVSTQIHDHKFGFTSHVLKGALRQFEYRIVPEPDGFSSRYQPHIARMRHQADTALEPFCKPINLTPANSFDIFAGQHYAMTTDAIHETVPLMPTVSVIRKDAPTLAQGGHAPLVYVPVGLIPDGDFDRHSFSSTMLWELINMVINA